MRVKIMAVTLTVFFFALGAASPGGAQTRNVAGLSRGVSKATAKKQYLSLVSPANLALNNFANEANGWTNSTSDTQAESEAGPVITQLTRVSEGLKGDRWPVGTQTKIKSLERALGPVTGDLKSLSTISSFNAAGWLSTFERNAKSLKSAVGHVRDALGLASEAS